MYRRKALSQSKRKNKELSLSTITNGLEKYSVNNKSITVLFTSFASQNKINVYIYKLLAQHVSRKSIDILTLLNSLSDYLTCLIPIYRTLSYSFDGCVSTVNAAQIHWSQCNAQCQLNIRTISWTYKGVLYRWHWLLSQNWLCFPVLRSTTSGFRLYYTICEQRSTLTAVFN